MIEGKGTADPSSSSSPASPSTSSSLANPFISSTSAMRTIDTGLMRQSILSNALVVGTTPINACSAAANKAEQQERSRGLEDYNDMQEDEAQDYLQEEELSSLQQKVSTPSLVSDQETIKEDLQADFKPADAVLASAIEAEDLRSLEQLIAAREATTYYIFQNSSRLPNFFLRDAIEVGMHLTAMPRGTVSVLHCASMDTFFSRSEGQCTVYSRSLNPVDDPVINDTIRVGTWADSQWRGNPNVVVAFFDRRGCLHFRVLERNRRRDYTPVTAEPTAPIPSDPESDSSDDAPAPPVRLAIEAPPARLAIMAAVVLQIVEIFCL
ncbi:hypothetical protein VE03_00891 [Pseudogymnoascus sp. 23342-1-I1]|nr:hypothetical protein VE03_00891 [Pseudogymnoascus sp. 23342-1-I1]